MTVQRAIELLQQMKERHGDVEIMFDCPHCMKSIRLEVVVAVALVQTTKTR